MKTCKKQIRIENDSIIYKNDVDILSNVLNEMSSPYMGRIYDELVKQNSIKRILDSKESREQNTVFDSLLK